MRMDNTGTRLRGQHILLGIGLLVLAAVPLLGEPYYTRLASRIMIYAICALSLDIILGYGGMVSFGHAAFFGIGAYTVAILAHHGIHSALIAWPAAVGFAGATALLIGVVSLRTSGVYFIIITLAFAQMLYYLFTGLEQYGGADGMAVGSRNSFGAWLDISGANAFYYLILGILLSMVYLGRRLVNSHFGMVIRAIRQNERRMRSIGFPTFRYKLVCFIISGAVAGLAGALMANQSQYVSPALLHWTRSGDMLIMVILGGIGSLIGPVMGAAGLLLAEEILSGYTEHWMIFLGPLLIFMVLFAKKGIYGFFSSGNHRDGNTSHG
jgi:branched-chain amino acid transport system permease protein